MSRRITLFPSSSVQRPPMSLASSAESDEGATGGAGGSSTTSTRNLTGSRSRSNSGTGGGLPGFFFSSTASRFTSASANLRGYEGRVRGATLRGKMFVLLEDPNSSAAAYFLHLYFLFLIVFATAAFCLETVRSLSLTDEQQRAWAAIEVFVSINWTIEFLLRVYCNPNLFRSWFTLIDLAAILPFYIELIAAGVTQTPFQSSRLPGKSAIRLIRVMRVLRLLKFIRSSDKLLLLIKAINRSLDGIYTMLFVLTLSTVFFSSLIFHAELSISDIDGQNLWVYTKGPLQGQVTQFQSIVESFWWCLVTMTTVGYGDAFPVSGFGRFVGGMTMVAAMLVLAFPATIIGANLTEVYEEYRVKKAEEEQYRQQLRNSRAATPTSSHPSSPTRELLSPRLRSESVGDGQISSSDNTTMSSSAAAAASAAAKQSTASTDTNHMASSLSPSLGANRASSQSYDQQESDIHLRIAELRRVRDDIDRAISSLERLI